MSERAAPPIEHDPRIEIVFTLEGPRRAQEAVLVEKSGLSSDDESAAAAATAYFLVQEQARASHRPGCSCCSPRGPVAAALNGLFLARAKGEVAWFTWVLALVHTGLGRLAVTAAVSSDPLVAARFRLAAPQE